MGQTTGRGKDAPTRAANRSIKQVLGYALVKDFRQRLSQVVAVEAVGQAVDLEGGASVGEVALA